MQHQGARTRDRCSLVMPLLCCVERLSKPQRPGSQCLGVQLNAFQSLHKRQACVGEICQRGRVRGARVWAIARQQGTDHRAIPSRDIDHSRPLTTAGLARKRESCTDSASSIIANGEVDVRKEGRVMAGDSTDRRELERSRTSARSEAMVWMMNPICLESSSTRSWSL